MMQSERQSLSYLGTFLAMHPAASSSYAQPAVYSISGLNLVADSPG
jgi:hypothetical protein